MAYDLPENIEIDFVIAMDQPISQADNLRPGDFGDAGALILGNTVCRLPNNLKQADKCEVELAVGVQVGRFRPVAIATASWA